MMKIGICDDNIILLKKYEDLVREITAEMELSVEVYSYHDGSEVVDALTSKPEGLDILFLDILMENMNGIDTAMQLRKAKANVVIIFLTSSEEFIFDSFESNPMAYIMKDQMTKEGFKDILLKSIESVKQKRINVLTLKDNETISYEDISYLMVVNDFLQVYRWDGAVFETKNISELDKVMKQGFFKVQENYYVGLRYINKIEKDLILLSDETKSEVPLDKQYTRELKLAFAKFMIECMQEK